MLPPDVRSRRPLARSRAVRLGLTLLLAGLAAAPAPAGAQLGRPRLTYQDAPSPTQGVLVPARSVADQDDATGLETNPALLPFGGRLSLVAIDTELDDRGRRMGQGTAFLLSSRLIGMFAAGVGFQWLRPPEMYDIGGYGKLTFGFAYGGRTASFGFSVSRYFSQRTAFVDDLDGLVTLDLGLLLRPSRYFSFGAVLHDVAQPRFRGVPLQRVWELGLAFRPLGTRLLTLDGEVRIGERRADVDPRVRLAVTPLPGLTVQGDVEFYRRAERAALAGMPEAPPRQTDVRVTAGVEITFDHTTGGGYAVLGNNGPGRRTAVGGTVVARLALDPVPALPLPPAEVPALKLSDELDPARHAALTAYLERLRRDRRVPGLLLRIEPGLSGSWAQMQELRALIGRLRAAGKRVFAYLDVAGAKHIYLASAAERVYQNPTGGIRLVGLGSQSLYFQGTLQKLGVRAEFIKIGEFKSAPESFTRSGPTGPARLQRSVLLDDLFGQLVRGLARSRGKTEDWARRTIDHGPYLAREALAAQLVDELAHTDELDKKVTARFGRRVKLVPHEQPPGVVDPPWAVPPSIAVIHVDGDMVDGKSRTIPLLGIKLAGAETIIKAIRAARDSASVRAIILRLDTPGGSAHAADRIYRELWKTRGKKPVIASMGGVAASGGYFIASACDTILAEPGTVTGSIGIFTGKVDVSGLLGKLGITVTELGRGRRANMDSLYHPYTPEERRVVAQKIRALYEVFLDRVAQGRKLTRVQVNEVARGRVWSGERARQVKLVDQLGGLIDAIRLAKQRAGMKPDDRVQLQLLPKQEESLVSKVIKLFISRDGTTTTSPLPPALRELAAALAPAAFYEANTPLYRLPFELRLEPAERR